MHDQCLQYTFHKTVLCGFEGCILPGNIRSQWIYVIEFRTDNDMIGGLGLMLHFLIITNNITGKLITIENVLITPYTISLQIQDVGIVLSAL